MKDEETRQRFEQWIRDNNPHLKEYENSLLGLDAQGRYFGAGLENHWTAWQAALASSAGCEHFWRTVERNGKWVTECEKCPAIRVASSDGERERLRTAAARVIAELDKISDEDDGVLYINRYASQQLLNPLAELRALAEAPKL